MNNFKSKNGFKIGKTAVGGENPCFIVAEIGINFDGNYDQALKMIDEVAMAGCNAAKFQLFRAERMYTKDAGKYKTVSGGKKDIIHIIKDSELPYEWIFKLKKFANRRGLEFFSSVCDEESVDALEKYGGAAFKIASYEITHIPLISYAAKSKKPLIISCGGSTIMEVGEAIEAAKSVGKHEIALLHCIAKYGASSDSANLNVIKSLQLAFPELVIGYSDHTIHPLEVPIAAVALGAKILEKHMTLDKRLLGPDHSFAVTPDELKLMVLSIRNTEKKIKKGEIIEINEKILGSSKRGTFSVESYVRKFAYRGIFSTKVIKKHEKFSKRNIAVLRPGEKECGLHPRYYDLLIKGYRATRDIPEAKGITWNDILQK